MIEIIEMLWRRLSPYLHILIRTPLTEDGALLFETHRSMLEACKKRDGALVRVWLERDLTQAAQVLLHRMQTNGESSE